MDKNAYRNELNALGFTREGKAALTEALLEARPAPAARRRHWPQKGLAAALAAVLLVGSALAAAGGTLWERYFGSLDETQQEVIHSLSQDLPAVESGGAVATPLAAFGDQDFYYLMLEIRAPEGVILPDYGKDEGYYQLSNPDTGESMTLTDGTGNDIRGNWEYDWMERNGDSGVLTAVILLWPREGVDYSDGTDKFLHIPGLWVQSPDKEYTPVFTEGWDFNIGACTGSIESRDLDVSGASVEDDLFGTLALDSLRLSPLGMRCRLTWEIPEEGSFPGAELTVEMEDGSVIPLASTMGSVSEEERWHEFYGPFQAPVDLSKAVAVHWQDVVIPLN